MRSSIINMHNICYFITFVKIINPFLYVFFYIKLRSFKYYDSFIKFIFEKDRTLLNHITFQSSISIAFIYFFLQYIPNNPYNYIFAYIYLIFYQGFWVLIPTLILIILIKISMYNLFFYNMKDFFYTFRSSTMNLNGLILNY